MPFTGRRARGALCFAGETAASSPMRRPRMRLSARFSTSHRRCLFAAALFASRTGRSYPFYRRSAFHACLTDEKMQAVESLEPSCRAPPRASSPGGARGAPRAVSAYTHTARMRQTLPGSFSAVSKRNFASKYAFESSRRDLHNALLCTALQSQFFVENLPTFSL